MILFPIIIQYPKSHSWRKWLKFLAKSKFVYSISVLCISNSLRSATIITFKPVRYESNNFRPPGPFLLRSWHFLLVKRNCLTKWYSVETYRQREFHLSLDQLLKALDTHARNSFTQQRRDALYGRGTILRYHCYQWSTTGQ